MKSLKLFAAGLALSLTAGTTAQAELSDILSGGTVKIAIPENFAPFGLLRP